jgi:predicted type IV restriction endonuclease
MIPLNLPKYEIKVRQEGERQQIFDVLRRRYVALTPEEWVRQHFVHYLIEHKGYPATMLANEVQLQVGDKQLRADTVLYNKDLKPRMIIEYKAPSVAVTQKVFNQVLDYNLLLRADYLVVTNGLSHYICKVDYSAQNFHFLDDIPTYSQIREF